MVGILADLATCGVRMVVCAIVDPGGPKNSGSRAIYTVPRNFTSAGGRFPENPVSLEMALKTGG